MKENEYEMFRMTHCYLNIKCMNLGTDLTSFIKINSKLITHINVKHKTRELLEDNIKSR